MTRLPELETLLQFGVVGPHVSTVCTNEEVIKRICYFKFCFGLKLYFLSYPIRIPVAVPFHVLIQENASLNNFAIIWTKKCEARGSPHVT